MVLGFELNQIHKPPKYAAIDMASSETQLKRAKRVYAGLIEIFERTIDYPDDSDLNLLELFETQVKTIVDELEFPYPTENSTQAVVGLKGGEEGYPI